MCDPAAEKKFYKRTLIVRQRSQQWFKTPSKVKEINTDLAPLVQELIDEKTYRMFGDVDVETLLYEKSYTVGLFDDSDELVGAVCVDNHPNVPSVAPWVWEEWVVAAYGLEHLHPFDTCWIHLAVAHQHYTLSFLKTALRFLFEKNGFWKHVLMIVPPGIVLVEFAEDLGVRVLPKGFASASRVQTIYMFYRYNFVSSFKMRRAVMEDNDDLVPLIDAHCNKLFSRLYGEFFIAEILSTHADAGRQIVVAEYGGYAVGVIILNESVNYDVIREEFEVTPYNGFLNLSSTHTSMCGSSNPSTTTMSLISKESIERLRERHSESTYVENLEPTPVHVIIIEPDDGRRSASMRQSWITTESRISDASSVTASLVGGQEVEEEEEEEEMEEEEEESGNHDDEDEDEDDYEIVTVSSAALLDVIRDQTSSSATSSESESSTTTNEVGFADKTIMRQAGASTRYNRQKTISKTAIMVKQMIQNIPKYTGDPNAFTVEVLVSQPEHCSCILPLLQSAFACFPERQYCLMTMPSVATENIFHFVGVPRRPFGTFPHELFALHRNSVEGSFRARRLTYNEISKVDAFLKMQVKDKLMKQIELSMEIDSDLQAFILLHEHQVVGLAVINDDVDVDFFYNHFEFQPLIIYAKHLSGTFGLIESLVISPAFHRHGQFFMKELHRLSDFSLIFYKVSAEDFESYRALYRPVANLLGYLIHLFPRKLPQYDEKNLKDLMPAKKNLFPQPNFALYISTPKITSMKRLQINSRIVVVGAGVTAIAFLEALVLTRNINFMVLFENVTVICPHGLPYQRPMKTTKEQFIPSISELDYQHMQQHSLRSFVNIAPGFMTGINRREKYLHVNNDESVLPYDLLVLACGEQFQQPRLKSSTSSFTQLKNDKQIIPSNLFIINTYNDVAACLAKVKQEKTKFDVKLPIIVYGHHLEAYCSIAGLLESGIPGRKVIFVDPYPDMMEVDQDDQERLTVMSVFNDSEIDEAVLESMHAEGVIVHESYRLLDWYHDSERNIITTMRFESKYRFLELDCQAVLMYDRRNVSLRTYSALTSAGLVFDGRLVIDTRCRTNDPNIYSCGTMTKYSRRYYADHMAHRFYDHYEVGCRLGLQIRKMLLTSLIEKKPARETQPAARNARRKVVVTPYKEPVVVSCMLPGRLYYASITKPGEVLPLEIAMSRDDYGTVLVTGEAKKIKEKGYFRLHINQHGAIEDIKCLSKEPIYVKNIRSLYGKHHKLLNKMVLRCEMNLIRDLFEFFKEPWTYAIYHDHFINLTNNIAKLFTENKMEGEKLTIKEIFIQNMKENSLAIQKSKSREVKQKFQESILYKELEKRVMEFLQDHADHLPMYVQPMIIRHFFQQFQNSGLFFPS